MTDANSTLSPEQLLRRRRLVIAGSAAVVVVIVVIVALVLLKSPSSTSAGKTTSPSPNGAQTTSASPSASPSPTPSASQGEPGATPVPTVDPNFGAPVAATVPVTGTGAFSGSVTTKLASLQFVTAEGTQAGEKSGPAAQIDVQIINGGSNAISLDAVSVNAYYGSAKTPAAPVSSNSGANRFSGTLDAGKSATVRFTFNVPKDQQSSLIVTVAKDASSPIIVFQ